LRLLLLWWRFLRSFFDLCFFDLEWCRCADLVPPALRSLLLLESLDWLLLLSLSLLLPLSLLLLLLDESEWCLWCFLCFLCLLCLLL
jgi:hypothetical protein